MPTYDYECENGHHFEMFQSMKDDPVSKCVECDAKVRRLIGPGAGFLFKGDGFYITDYRSSDYKKKQKSESSAGKKKDGDSKASPKKQETKSSDSKKSK